MIRIVYDRPNHRVTAKGHAGAAPHGEDLVCAGVSALLCTLAEAVRCLEQRGLASCLEIRLFRGDGAVSFVSEYDCLVNAVVDTVCLGLESIAKQYPQYVTYTVEASSRSLSAQA